MKGKTIRIYLADGDPNGIRTAEIINWTGNVLVAPRTQLSQFANRDEARRTGVYCLVGPDPENPLRDVVYVGEGDNVLKRLKKHDKEKEFWTRFFVVTSKDQNLTKSHVRYLESQMIATGRQTGRAKINNATTPPLPPLPEPDVADMDYFLGHLQIVFPVLGLPFLQPKPQAATGNNDDVTSSPMFKLSVGGADATAREVGGEFIVLQGSTARKEGVPSWTSYKGLRDQLVEDGQLVDGEKPDLFVFADDIPFASPSAGGAVVNAGNINGRSAWKTSDTNETYQQWHEKNLPVDDEDANGG